MRSHLVLVTILVAGCRGPQARPDASPVLRPLQADAERHSCGLVIETRGTERRRVLLPCWDAEDEGALAQEKPERRSEVVAAACDGIPHRERQHSPLAHAKSIAEIIPHRLADHVVGVRIVFEPVPGLTADYMRRAVACHRARVVELGDPAERRRDPMLVRGAEVRVAEHEGQVEVLIVTPTERDGLIALRRAEDLGRERTATR